jgi:hypothetical protein
VIVRAPRPEGQFYILDKRISEDKRLSWAARGLLVFLLGKPDNWQVSPAALVNEVAKTAKPTGRDGTYGLLAELMDAGYIERKQSRNEDGTHGALHYVVSESPLPALPYPAGPHPAEPTQISTEDKQVLKEKKEKRVREIFVPPNGDLELQVDPGLMDNWRKAFPALDVENQIERAELWLNANPANRKSNYERFLLNWLTRAQDSAPRVNAQRMTPAPAATGRRPVHPSWYAGSTTHPTQETGHVFDVVATEVTR